MGIASLIYQEKPVSDKMVAVKLPTAIVKKIQSIRKSTGKTNSEVYSALLSEGLDAYDKAMGKGVKKKVVPMSKRGRKK